jgi:tRNA U34 5-methylaminomethyl-2-thiouridine-forming methyltransferase MnmC
VYDKELKGKKQLLETSDGTSTLYSEGFGEAYHSPKDGALHESLEKHVRSALRFTGGREKLTILDICFGLGYNTLATLYEVRRRQMDTKIHIISPELDRELVGRLGSFDYPEAFAQFKPIIEALSRDHFYEDVQFRIEILIGDAREKLPQIDEKFDIVYQDAFSPKHNPLLWTKEYFAQIRKLMREDGILTTYSVAVAMRMGLYENGFRLYNILGEGLRDWMVASPALLEGMEPIDMVLKQKRNPDARSLRDASFL